MYTIFTVNKWLNIISPEHLESVAIVQNLATTKGRPTSDKSVYPPKIGYMEGRKFGCQDPWLEIQECILTALFSLFLDMDSAIKKMAEVISQSKMKIGNVGMHI